MCVKAAKIKQVLFWEAEESSVERWRRGGQIQRGTYYCSLQSPTELKWGVDSLQWSVRPKKRLEVSVFQQNTHHFHFGVFEYLCNDSRRPSHSWEKQTNMILASVHLFHSSFFSSQKHQRLIWLKRISFKSDRYMNIYFWLANAYWITNTRILQTNQKTNHPL